MSHDERRSASEGKRTPRPDEVKVGRDVCKWGGRVAGYRKGSGPVGTERRQTGAALKGTSVP